MEIIYRAVEKYTEVRLKAKKSNATVNRELELLRRSLRLAKDRGLLLSLPKISLLPEHNTRQGFFERPELEGLVAALPEHLADMARFPYFTGMRLGEIKSLRWEDVDREVGALRLRVEHAKTGDARTMMLVGRSGRGDRTSLPGEAVHQGERSALRLTTGLHEDHECSEEPGHGHGPLLRQTLERADLLLEIAELTSELSQAAWLDLRLRELGVQRGSLGQQ